MSLPTPADASPSGIGSRLAALVRGEAFPGILLVLCAVIAMAAANLPWHTVWTGIWHAPLTLGAGGAGLTRSVEHWINDGLMVLFFLAVGLEIKHELLHGELATARRAALPIVAAVGGMVVPAGIYAAFNAGGPGAAGWGIPVATDIAFALGVLALLGRRVPLGLKVFLAALAIADDLGAVLVIALFYTERISAPLLGAGALLLAAAAICNRLGVRAIWPYALLGVALWLAFLESGVHPTIAGVLLALTIPADRRSEEATSPLQRVAHGLAPLNAFVIVPLFALANAGVMLGGSLGEVVGDHVAQGVALGLLVGKPVGIFFASWLVVKLGWGALPTAVTWRHIHGVAWLGGIGFTMSLFIDGLAFANDPVHHAMAKLAILVASMLAGVVGFILLRRLPPVA